MKGPGKGKTNNPAGRPAGKPNKVTGELRQRIKEFLDSNFDAIQKDFEGLDPEKRILMYEKYLKFVLPSLQATDVSLDIAKMTEAELDRVIIRLLKIEQ